LSSSSKQDIALTPAGKNKLEAKGNYKVDPGTKVVAKVSLAGKAVQNVRFTLK
jgi:hypothetical protein